MFAYLKGPRAVAEHVGLSWTDSVSQDAEGRTLHGFIRSCVFYGNQIQRGAFEIVHWKAASLLNAQETAEAAMGWGKQVPSPSVDMGSAV